MSNQKIFIRTCKGVSCWWFTDFSNGPSYHVRNEAPWMLTASSIRWISHHIFQGIDLFNKKEKATIPPINIFYSKFCNHEIKSTCSFLFSINLANTFITELQNISVQNLYMCLTEIKITLSLKNKNPKSRLFCNHNLFLTYLPQEWSSSTGHNRHKWSCVPSINDKNHMFRGIFSHCYLNFQ